MKDLIIVGAGGFGREAYHLAKSIGKWNIKGFIDDNIDALNGIIIDSKIIGAISEWKPNDNQVFAMGISSPIAKEKVAKLLKERGAEFVTLISPKTVVNETATIGEGSVITSGSSVGDNAVLGNFVHIACSMIGQDSVIGDFSTTTGFVNTVTSKVGRRVFVGSHSVLLADVADDAFICAGSIVFTKVKAGTKVMGNPAKKVVF